MTWASFWRRLPAAALRGFTNGRVPSASASLVEPSKARHRHVHLAPHLEHLGHGRSGEAFGDDGDGGDVRRHVLADAAVTTRRRLAVAAALVAQAHRQAVDLQLADVGDGLVGKAAGDARPPRLELLARHRVVEAHHRLGMHDRGEQDVRGAADVAGQRVVELDVGVVGDELAQLADQRVEVAVGDLGVVEGVVTVIVVADELGQLDEAQGRVGDRGVSHGDHHSAGIRRCGGRSRGPPGTPVRPRRACASRAHSAASRRAVARNRSRSAPRRTSSSHSSVSSRQ